jgi:hypothetical protein
VGYDFFVRDGDLGSHRPPAEQLFDALAPGGAVPCPALGVVEHLRDRSLELADVAGRDQVRAQSVGSDDLGDRPGVGDHERGGAGHQLGGREREALVEGRHAGQLGRTHQLDQLGVADAVHEADRVVDRQLVDQLLGATALLGLGDEQQLEVALGAQLGERLEQRRDALHRRIGAGHRHDPAGHAGLGRRHERVVDAEQDDLHPRRVDTEVLGDVALRRLGRREDLARLASDPGLHLHEAVPAGERELAPRVLGGRDVDAAVVADRVVQRRQQRQPELLDLEHPVAEDLVVVDDVELVDAAAELAYGAQAERLRLREAGRAHRRELLDVDPVPELLELRQPERVGLAVEVEARQLRQLHTGVELRVGLSREHLHRVSEVDELTAEVADVDALSPAVRLASIGQQRDSHPHLNL